MKKKILIPVLGLFVVALAFSISDNSSSNTEEMSGFFIESDNVAFAEAGACVPCPGWYCFYNGVALYGYKTVYF